MQPSILARPDRFASDPTPCKRQQQGPAHATLAVPAAPEKPSQLGLPSLQFPLLTLGLLACAVGSGWLAFYLRQAEQTAAVCAGLASIYFVVCLAVSIFYL